MMRAVFCLLGLWAWANPASADGTQEALSWLARMAVAAQQANYTGTFVYQTGSRIETSRIAHLNEGGSEYERLEALDGSPREVVRKDAELHYYLPAEQLVIADRLVQRRFPAMSNFSPAALSQSYSARMGSMDRVAGVPAQQVVVEPRDELRYARVFWVEPQSGLLLKSRVLDPHGRIVEQFAFSQIDLAPKLTRDGLRSRYEEAAASWRQLNAHGEDLRADQAAWAFRTKPPGFRQVVALRRPLRGGAGDAVQVVFCDGLTTVSVFVEALEGRSAAPAAGPSRAGATNIHKRVVAKEFVVTALGELPAEALRSIADGVELRGK